MQPDCVPRLAGGRHEIPVAGSGRPGLDDEQVQASEENHRHHPYHPVLRILLRCRAVHHLVAVCRRGLGVGLQQSLFFVGAGLCTERARSTHTQTCLCAPTQSPVFVRARQTSHNHGMKGSASPLHQGTQYGTLTRLGGQKPSPFCACQNGEGKGGASHRVRKGDLNVAFSRLCFRLPSGVSISSSEKRGS